MVDAVHLNVTPIAAPVFVRRGQSLDLASATHPQQARSAVTTSVGNVYVLYKSGDPPSGRSNWDMIRSGGSVYPPVRPAVQIDRVAADRVRMLATRFEGNASAQDLARLEILTARLSRLVPRTTAADIAKVEQTVDLLEEIDASLTALAAEYDS